MSIHPVTAPTEPLRALVESAIREPSNVTGDPVTGAITFHFTPDLSTSEAATFAELDALARSGLAIDPADWPAVRDELPTLRAFMQASSPTAAQSVAAVKSIVRVLRAILKD